MVSVSEVKTESSGAFFSSDNSASAIPKKIAKTATCKIWFWATASGIVLALTDEQILASVKDWASQEGILLSPEGAAAAAAYDHLIGMGFLSPSDRIVLFNTGSGNKYTDVLAKALRVQPQS